MDETKRKRRSNRAAESIDLGGGASRISAVIFFLLCFVPVFSTVMFGAVDNATWVLISIFWVLIVLLWLGETWNSGEFLFNSSSIQIPLIGFLLIGLIQLLPLGGGDSGALLNVPASHALSLDPYSTRFFVIKLTVYAVFFSACLAFINNERRLKKAVYLIVIFGALMAFFGILQRLTNPDGIYGVRETKQAIPFGPFVNQHHFATFMQMTGGLTLGLLFGENVSKERKILLATAAVVMGVATVLTGSRGGLLGFLAVVALVTVLNLFAGRWSRNRSFDGSGTARQPKIAMAVGGVALIVVIFGVVLFLGGNDSLLRGIGAAKADADISSGRMDFWPIALRIFLEHPIIGAGFEAFGVAFTVHDKASGQFRIEQAHNEYLQTLADAGIAGFICVVAFIYLLLKKGLGAIVRAVGLRREAAIGAVAGCLGVLIHSFFDFPLRTPSNAFFFLLLCTIATVSVETEEIAPSRRRHRSTEP